MKKKNALVITAKTKKWLAVKAKEIQGLEKEVWGFEKMTNEKIMQIGKELFEVRARCHDEGIPFNPWCEENFDHWSHGTRYDFLAVWEKFGQCPNFGRFDSTALKLLAADKNKTAREFAIVSVKADKEQHITFTDAQRMIDEVKQSEEKKSQKEVASLDPDHCNGIYNDDGEPQSIPEGDDNEVASLDPGVGRLQSLPDDDDSYEMEKLAKRKPGRRPGQPTFSKNSKGNIVYKMYSQGWHIRATMGEKGNKFGLIKCLHLAIAYIERQGRNEIALLPDAVPAPGTAPMDDVDEVEVDEHGNFVER